MKLRRQMKVSIVVKDPAVLMRPLLKAISTHTCSCICKLFMEKTSMDMTIKAGLLMYHWIGRRRRQSLAP